MLPLCQAKVNAKTGVDSTVAQMLGIMTNLVYVFSNFALKELAMILMHST